MSTDYSGNSPPEVESSSLDPSGLDTLQGKLPVNEQQEVGGRCLRPQKHVLPVAVQPTKKQHHIADERKCEEDHKRKVEMVTKDSMVKTVIKNVGKDMQRGSRGRGQGHAAW